MAAIGWVRVGLASLLLMLGIAGAFVSNGLWGGIAQLQEWFSPYNLANLAVLAVTFGPGIALLS